MPVQDFSQGIEAVSGEAARIGRMFNRFNPIYKPPLTWFSQPDHIAFKAYNATGYEALMDQARLFSTRQTECEQGGRRLGTTELIHPVALGSLGTIQWVEIMEPRPEKVGQDTVGLDHVEFFFDDFEQVRRELGYRGIKFEDQRNESHSWVSFKADWIEVKLNDGTLEDVVEVELADGRARVIWQKS